MSYSDTINQRETSADTGRVGMLAANTTVLGSNSQDLANEVWNDVATTQYTQAAATYAISYTTFESANLANSLNVTSQDAQETAFKGALGTNVTKYMNTPANPVPGTQFTYTEDSATQHFTIDDAITTDMFD